MCGMYRLGMVWTACLLVAGTAGPVRAGAEDQGGVKGLENRIQQLNVQLMELEGEQNTTSDEGSEEAKAAARKARDAQYRKVLTLREGLRHQLAERMERQRADHERLLAKAFPGVVDLYFGADLLASGKPGVAGVKLEGPVELGGRTLLRFSNDHETWIIDAAQIVAIRGRVEKADGASAKEEKK